jgi:hypothetical protein
MKIAYLLVNGAVLRVPLEDEAVNNFGAFLAKAAGAKKQFFWQEKKCSVWKSDPPNGSTIVINDGTLNGYMVVPAPPEPPNLQQQALDILKKSVDEASDGDEWKKE